jgi:hypothetical protein
MAQTRQLPRSNCRVRWKGYPSVFVTLASIGANPPLAGFEKGVETVEKTIEEIVNSGKDVVLVMHSHGGYPGSQAMSSFMNNNKGEDGKGGMVRLVWLTSFVLKEGRCFV